MRVAFVGTYDRAPHGRNAIVIEALRSAGVEVIERHVPLWDGTADKVAAARGSPWQLGRVSRRVFGAWRSLAAVTADLPAVDVVWIGATGLVDLPLARRLADRLEAPLVFDPLVSLGETVRDRGLAKGGWRLPVYERIERRLFALADQVVVDTAAHAAAWATDLGLDAARTLTIPVGAPRIFHDATPAYAPRPGEPLSVVYFGQFIPLHGVEVMLQAADRLRGQAIDFTFVGVGQTQAVAERLAGDLALARVRFVPAWLPPDDLIRAHISGADVCLGVFADRPKTARVVPYKVYAALAAGRAVVTGDTPALREGLVPGEDVIAVPCGDPAALAQALTRLAAAPDERLRLAVAGRATWEQRFSADRLGSVLRAALAETVAVHRAERRGIGPRQRWRAAHLAGLIDGAPPFAGAWDGPPAVLDVGCGDGALALALGGAREHERGDSGFGGAAFGGTVLAFDADLERARAARGRARRSTAAPTHVFVADAAAIPLAADSVQGAVSGEVLEHVADDVAAAREIARVLTGGGALAITVPAGAARFGTADRAAGHRRRYDAAALERLLGDAGLGVERLTGWGFPFGRLYDAFVQRPALAVLRRRAGEPSNLQPGAQSDGQSDGQSGGGLRRKSRASMRAQIAWAVRRLARLRAIDIVWQALFAIDARVAASAGQRGRREARGSGWDAVGRKAR
ncbi:MAG: glycosyltransferase [Ardenticatenales bacterium]|nr:glycosyltransferase [Ardenticatenales bacterium]